MAGSTDFEYSMGLTYHYYRFSGWMYLGFVVVEQNFLAVVSPLVDFVLRFIDNRSRI
jgi:hypothetical protein